MEFFVLKALNNEANPYYKLSVNDSSADLTLLKSEQEIIVDFNSANRINIFVNKGVNAECIIRLEEIKDKINVNITLEEQAFLKQHFIRLSSKENLDVELNVDVKQDANIECLVGEFSSANVTYHLTSNLNEVNANSYIRLATIAANEEVKQFQVKTVSNAPYTTGKMDNYGVCKDFGNLLIEGIGTMVKGVNGSTSDQNNKIIMFDLTSKAVAKPYLFIDEYDVKASHSCGVGRIDENQIYYLCSRGLSTYQARRFITLGYLTPILTYLSNENLKAEINDVLTKKVE
jgi:Fe-S cluster assembly protein SufD